MHNMGSVCCTMLHTQHCAQAKPVHTYFAEFWRLEAAGTAHLSAIHIAKQHPATSQWYPQMHMHLQHHDARIPAHLHHRAQQPPPAVIDALSIARLQG